MFYRPIWDDKHTFAVCKLEINVIGFIEMLAIIKIEKYEATIIDFGNWINHSEFLFTEQLQHCRRI